MTRNRAPFAEPRIGWSWRASWHSARLPRPCASWATPVAGRCTPEARDLKLHASLPPL